MARAIYLVNVLEGPDGDKVAPLIRDFLKNNKRWYSKIYFAEWGDTPRHRELVEMMAYDSIHPDRVFKNGQDEDRFRLQTRHAVDGIGPTDIVGCGAFVEVVGDRLEKLGSCTRVVAELTTGVVPDMRCGSSEYVYLDGVTGRPGV